jgi:arylsulfatase A-like enzyme
VLRAQKRLVLTPNIDRLAGQGVSFLRAYCPTPACNPSRAGLLTGIRPHVSTFVANNGGIFFRDWNATLANAVTLPQQLRLNGYFTAGTGKIFHNASHAGADAPLSWNQWVVLSGTGSWTKSPWSPKSAPTLWTGDADWGLYNVSLTNLQDYKRADFIARLIENGAASDYDSGLGRNVTVTLPTNAPFFLACGIFHPHVPYSNPPELLALFPTNEITFTRQMLVDGTNDLYDLPPTGLTFVPANTNSGDAVLTGGDFRAIAQQGQALEPGDGDLHAMRDMISHYLASAALADRCVGRLLDALDSSPYATNTIVALWSDHGYHLGEKLRACTKFTLWENAANVVFVMRDPRLPGGQRCYRTVGTGDLYQTLCSMAGVPVPASVSGRDLSPLLANPQRPWNIPALTTLTRTNHNAIRTEPFRYIRYHGDVNDAELYHMDVDPNEITNVLTRAEYAADRAAVDHLLEIALAEGTFPDEQVLNLPNWRNGYWGHGRNVGAAADLVDADNDGITNVLEAVLGLNPLRPDTNTMPRLAMPSAAAGADLFYRTTYLPITNGPVTEVQASADLLNWSTLWNSNVPGAVDSVTSSQLPDGRLVLEIPLAPTNHPNQSYRLKVHHP